MKLGTQLVFVANDAPSGRDFFPWKLKGTFQKLLSGFFPLRGGVPPLSASFFEHNDFPLRGGGYPPIPLRVFGQNDFPPPPP